MARAAYTAADSPKLVPGRKWADSGVTMTVNIGTGTVAVEVLHDLDVDQWISDGGLYDASQVYRLLPPAGTSIRIIATGDATFNLHGVDKA